jgi:predicted Zn-dependent peptidase
MSSVLTSRTVSEHKLPKHPSLVHGKLDNGFTYIILPNAVPPGRFEAHLEVLSGSAHELEDQVFCFFLFCTCLFIFLSL